MATQKRKHCYSKIHVGGQAWTPREAASSEPQPFLQGGVFWIIMYSYIHRNFSPSKSARLGGSFSPAQHLWVSRDPVVRRGWGSRPSAKPSSRTRGAWTRGLGGWLVEERRSRQPEASGLLFPVTPELPIWPGPDTACLLIEQMNTRITIQKLKPRDEVIHLSEFCR